MAKDSPRITAGELQRLVESWGQKPKKKKSNIPYITTCCLGGFQEKLSSLIQRQTPANSVSDTTGTSNGTGFYGQMKLKKELLGSKPTR